MRILVADDNRDAVSMLAAILYEMNGYDVARTIRERCGAARPLLIAISGHFKKGADRVLAQIVGFDHFFPKPCDPNALVAVLE